jgi:hypothetical protein
MMNRIKEAAVLLRKGAAMKKAKSGLGKSATFVCGLLVGAVAVGTAGVAFGAGTVRNLAAHYDGIKIYVDQQLVTPKDANGTVVDPFIVDGTTYLPVRAVAGALGKEVGWDGTTKSVYIGTQPPASQTPTTPTATGNNEWIDLNSIDISKVIVPNTNSKDELDAIIAEAEKRMSAGESEVAVIRYLNEDFKNALARHGYAGWPAYTYIFHNGDEYVGSNVIKNTRSKSEWGIRFNSLDADIVVVGLPEYNKKLLKIRDMIEEYEKTYNIVYN